jgi:hypothetical protein
MGLKGVSFVNQQLALVPSCVQSKPRAWLVGSEIHAEHLHDEVWGQGLTAHVQPRPRAPRGMSLGADRALYRADHLGSIAASGLQGSTPVPAPRRAGQEVLAPVDTNTMTPWTDGDRSPETGAPHARDDSRQGGVYGRGRSGLVSPGPAGIAGGEEVFPPGDQGR